MSNNRGGWKKILSCMHGIVDCTVLTIFFLLILYGLYGIWDSHLLVNQALADQYEIYKPQEETESFGQLQAINPDVIGWLDVYGTNIDYPLVQGKDDWQYINTDAKGQYSLTGALFLSQMNKRDFSDFNSIVYGHNMTPKIMFGNIKDFRDKSFFDQHPYGFLFDGKKEYGLSFFAILRVDAYDKTVYRVVRENGQREYVGHLLSYALHTRPMDIGEGDRILLLSTCSNAQTNGRDVLLAKITDQVPPDTFVEEDASSPMKFVEGVFGGRWDKLPLWAKLAPWILLIAIIALMWVLLTRRKRRKGKYAKRDKDTAGKVD